MLGKCFVRGVTFWKGVPQGPPDSILGISEAFKNDSDSAKVSLGVGAYRDDSGKPWVLPSVQKAKELISASGLDHEYAPIEGLQSFRRAAVKLAYGDAPAISEGKVASLQSLSGTGSLRLGMAFLQRFHGSKVVYIPKPTWGNHKSIVQHTGLEWKEYAYFNPVNNGLDFEGMVEDLRGAPSGSTVLLHACAHNPTGVDLTQQQWNNLLGVFKDKGHLAFFDSAYQGFASGDIDRDAYGLREFLKEQVPVLLAQSFAKNFGLYGERIGQFSMVCADPEETQRVMSQLKILARAIYSNPPIYGARVVSTILESAELYTQWLSDIKTMAGRISSMRHELVKNLKDSGSSLNWQHITDQIGMFAFTGMTVQQSQQLMDQHHVYLTLDGRISIAGLNTKNVAYVAQAIHAVTK